MKSRSPILVGFMNPNVFISCKMQLFQQTISAPTKDPPHCLEEDIEVDLAMEQQFTPMGKGWGELEHGSLDLE